MGVENNECVIATTWDNKVVKEIEQWLKNLPEEEQSLFAFVPAWVNNKTSVILAPDGSKKRWPEAEEGEALRNKFIELLRTFDYDDGSSPLDWVEVGYGDFGQKVLRGNNVNRFSDDDYAIQQQGGKP
jgi:hypothetical protein